MIDFGFENTFSIKNEIEKFKYIKKDFLALEKFKVTFELYDFFKKNPNIKKWCVAHERDTYDIDEKLEIGVYIYYSNEISQDLTEPDLGFRDEEIEFYKKMTPEHKYLFSIATDYYLSHNSDQSFGEYLFPHGKEYLTNETGMKKFITDFIGSEYLQKWEISSQAKSLQNNILEANKQTKTNKI